MHYRTLGKTGLNVSVVGFGAIKLPDVSEEQACATLHRALDLGINFIDTARNYTKRTLKFPVCSNGKVRYALVHHVEVNQYEQRTGTPGIT